MPKVFNIYLLRSASGAFLSLSLSPHLHPMSQVLYHEIHLHQSSQEWLLMIHGAGGSTRTWKRQIEDLNQHFNLLVVDLPGHGQNARTQSLDALYTFEKISSRVWEVVDELKIQKIHLLGVSLGAIIALDMELRHPDRVKSLVLAGAIVRLDNKLKVIANMSLTLAKLIGYRAFYKMAAFIALPRKNHRTSREVFIRESKALSIEEFRKWTKMYRTLNKTLNELFLKATEVPRLLLMGEQDHLFLKPALDYIAKRRNGLVTVIPRCGHVVNIERPQEFNLNCIKFIEDLGL